MLTRALPRSALFAARRLAPRTTAIPSVVTRSLATPSNFEWPASLPREDQFKKPEPISKEELADRAEEQGFDLEGKQSKTDAAPRPVESHSVEE